MFGGSTPLGGGLRPKDCSLKPVRLLPGLRRGHTLGDRKICGLHSAFDLREMLFEALRYFKICKIFIQSYKMGIFKDS